MVILSVVNVFVMAFPMVPSQLDPGCDTAGDFLGNPTLFRRILPIVILPHISRHLLAAGVDVRSADSTGGGTRPGKLCGRRRRTRLLKCVEQCGKPCMVVVFLLPSISLYDAFSSSERFAEAQRIISS